MNNPPPGDGHARCGARTRSGGNCRLPAGHGTGHVGIGRCRLHGGSTPTHERAAERRQAEAAARRLGLDLDDISPGEALAREIARSAALVASYSAMLSELDEAELTWGLTQRRIRPGPAGQPQVEVVQSAVSIRWSSSSTGNGRRCG